MAENEVWSPGSFTKNFSWGPDSNGLSELHSVIRRGFNDRAEDVPRNLFRRRVADIGERVLIPLNFFLFNRSIDGDDMIIADELVFQAVSWDHSPAFDKVALFAFLFSRVGRWKGSKKEQRRPALWANRYVLDHISPSLKWEADKINTRDIENFINLSSAYSGKTTEKLSSNLNYLLHIGRIEDFGEKRVSRWWVDCLFLALDRLIEDAIIDGKKVEGTAYQGLLKSSDFLSLTGEMSVEKELAIKHLTRLYESLGARNRFSEEAVISKTRAEIPDSYPARPNDPRPRGAVHLTNPRILKSIPPLCCDLARLAGFEVLSPNEVEEMQLEEFVKYRSNAALAVLKERGIKPTMSLEELLIITRGE